MGECEINVARVEDLCVGLPGIAPVSGALPLSLLALLPFTLARGGRFRLCVCVTLHLRWEKGWGAVRALCSPLETQGGVRLINWARNPSHGSSCHEGVISCQRQQRAEFPQALVTAVEVIVYLFIYEVIYFEKVV